jgi:hypothetical protein
MQSWQGGTYSSSQPAVASAAPGANCRAILCTTAGSITYQQGPIGAPGPATTVAMVAGQILPIELNDGIISGLGAGAYELLA